MPDTLMLAGFSGDIEHGNPTVRKSGMGDSNKMKEFWDSLDAESKELLLQDLKDQKTRKEYNKMVEIAESLGYIVWSHSANHTQFSANKGTLDDVPTMHLNVFKKADGEWRAILSHQIRAVSITTHEFSFPHDNFKDVFERQVMAAAVRCKDLHP